MGADAARITTIQVTEGTLRALQRLKEETASATYDELVRKLIQQRRKTREYLLGAIPGLRPFDKRERGHRD
ncbi:MAG TPA: hypothetical protein VI997_11370 [Candidatus Thermoplasmatota archaeon]|nr:hypothetical protein [Candidatus Thermoplasmatota archaeon]